MTRQQRRNQTRNEVGDMIADMVRLSEQTSRLWLRLRKQSRKLEAQFATIRLNEACANLSRILDTYDDEESGGPF